MKSNKKIIHYIVAFIIPIIIFSLAMASRNLYPFGSNSLRFIDALSQYPDFFEGLRSFSLFNFNMQFIRIATTIRSWINPLAMRVRLEKAIALEKNITPSDIINLVCQPMSKNQKE